MFVVDENLSGLERYLTSPAKRVIPGTPDSTIIKQLSSMHVGKETHVFFVTRNSRDFLGIQGRRLFKDRIHLIDVRSDIPQSSLGRLLSTYVENFENERRPVILVTKDTEKQLWLLETQCKQLLVVDKKSKIYYQLLC